jgi:putative ABC transport system ATP-binding protein
MPSLDVKDLTVSYESGGYMVHALDKLSFHADDGELVLLLGPSGSGKTTLLSCLGGILRPNEGSILVGDTDVAMLEGRELQEYRRSGVGIVFQAFNLVPSLTALENVDAPLRGAGKKNRAARARAEELLKLVGLEERMHHRPGKLSGGQQQRVAIARALGHDPPMLLADEPTAHLDYAQVEGVLRTIRSLASPGRLVVVSTHDDRITPLADRVIELADFMPLTHDRREVHLDSGQVLFEEGTRGALIYVVERGQISITRRRPSGGDEVVATYGPGEYFGELGPLLGFPRAGTALAKAPTLVVGYTVTEFRELVGADKIGDLLGRGPRKTIRKKSAKRKTSANGKATIKQTPAKRKAPAKRR